MLIVLSFVLAWTISPIVWQRIQAARTAKSARQGLLTSAAALAVFYILIVFIGILFLPFFPAGKPGGALLSEFLSVRAGPYLGSVLFVAVMAAIISTMDAAINAGAFSLTRDIYQQLVPSASPRKGVGAARLATLLMAAAAFLVASRFQDILKTLGLASEIMAEGLFIPGVAMIFLKQKIPLAGLLSLTFGGGFSLLNFIGEAKFVHLPFPSWPFSLPYGLALSAAGFLLGWALERRKDRRI